MKEINEMLDRWIYNSIIRKQLRDLIVKEIDKERTKILTWERQLKDKK
tara:strand:- start:41 stop:184 length:144 start_codon:yes stop_codon:yes gene_type:complete